MQLDRSKLRVLIADDELENAQAYARALRGYEIVMAARGDEGMAVLAEHAVDIVVTDQRMPGSTGALLLERARAVNPLVRRVVVSASAQPEHLLEAINRGEVERYLLKPVEPEHLRAVVDQLAAEYVRMIGHRQRVVELQDQLQSLRRDGVAADQGELLERAELELVRARRYRRPLAVIVVVSPPPLDELRLRARLRELDISLHIGDRLVLLLPETDATAAGHVWDRLRPIMASATPHMCTVPEDGTSLQALLLIPTLR